MTQSKRGNVFPEPVVAKLPDGRTALPADWFARPFAEGTTLLARELASKRRQRMGKCKLTPDEAHQAKRRLEAKWAFEMARRGVTVEIEHASGTRH